MNQSVFKLSLLLCILPILAAGCRLDPLQDRLPLLGEENSIANCTDGFDNDSDGLVDCADPDCRKTNAEHTAPGNSVCPVKDGILAENTEYTCSDGIDNNGNGYVDCRERDCRALSVCCIKSVQDETGDLCFDGIDNDCDGFADCRDFSCRDSNPTQCCPDKIKENTPERCSDGKDNDCNSYIDCRDNSCSNLEVCKGEQPQPEIDLQLCSDGKDNNFNGLADCSEPSCRGFDHCKELVPEPRPLPINFNSLTLDERKSYLEDAMKVCHDGIDNDKDGLVDCKEYFCVRYSLLKLRKEEQGIYQFKCDPNAKPE